jgi:hypothetical protein
MALPAALAALGTSAPVPTQPRPQPAQPVPAPAPPAQPAVAVPSFDGGSAAVDQKPQMADPLADVSIPPQPVVVFSDDVEELLDEGCVLYPVVADKRGQAVLPYSFAKSEDAFRAWNLGKRKSTEVRLCSFTSYDLQGCADILPPLVPTVAARKEGQRVRAGQDSARHSYQEGGVVVSPAQQGPIGTCDGHHPLCDNLKTNRVPSAYAHSACSVCTTGRSLCGGGDTARATLQVLWPHAPPSGIV